MSPSSRKIQLLLMAHNLGLLTFGNVQPGGLRRGRAVLFVVCWVVMILAPAASGQTDADTPTSAQKDLPTAPAQVRINPVARDEEIRQRLQNVLEATGWFTDPGVRVEEGIVFLSGRTESDELKKWAGDLARNTQEVVAVANRIEVQDPSMWDFRPAWGGLLILWRDIIRSLPFVLFGLLILVLSIGAGILTTRAVRPFLRRRVRTKLLQTMIARVIGGFVFLCGVYLVMRVSGLTQLALTVVGGTGLIGLVIGIAFRDITENFLASIFLSLQRPFETGDLVEISGETGYIQQLNMRTTILMTLDGNLVQIPNANVYKTNVRNFTTNSNRREDFTIGIGYDASISDAQEIARKVLADHPAVLNDPEPAVLADSLGVSTVSLRIYFWLDGRAYSWLKVRSSVIRLVKVAFQNHGISMPDEAREVVFPQGIPVTLLDKKPSQPGAEAPDQPDRYAEKEIDAVETKAEAGLYSEAAVIEEQARHAQTLKEGENLLPIASPADTEKKTAKPKP